MSLQNGERCAQAVPQLRAAMHWCATREQGFKAPFSLQIGPPLPPCLPCRQHHPPVRLPMAWRRLNCLCVTAVHRLLGWGRELREAEARTDQRLEQ